MHEYDPRSHRRVPPGANRGTPCCDPLCVCRAVPLRVSPRVPPAGPQPPLLPEGRLHAGRLPREGQLHHGPARSRSVSHTLSSFTRSPHSHAHLIHTLTSLTHYTLSSFTRSPHSLTHLSHMSVSVTSSHPIDIRLSLNYDWSPLHNIIIIIITSVSTSRPSPTQVHLP